MGESKPFTFSLRSEMRTGLSFVGDVVLITKIGSLWLPNIWLIATGDFNLIRGFSYWTDRSCSGMKGNHKNDPNDSRNHSEND
jgi:hypothetical protein